MQEKRKESRRNIEDSCQITRKESKRRNKKNYKTPETVNTVTVSTYLSTVTWNVNGLNGPIKRYREAEWSEKQGPHVCCLDESHFRSKDTHRLKTKGRKEVLHANGNKKKAGQYLYQIR